MSLKRYISEWLALPRNMNKDRQGRKTSITSREKRIVIGLFQVGYQECQEAFELASVLTD